MKVTDMRLLLSITNEEQMTEETTGESIQHSHSHGSEEAAAFGADHPMHQMLALLDEIHASTSAEAFTALRRAFPESALQARVEAVRKSKLYP